MPSQKTATSTVDSLMADAFNRSRDPRSDAYKAGTHAALTRTIENIKTPLPYELGTAEADAFFAGEAEGRTIFMSAWEQEQIA